jgi:hypothetical protein
MAGGNVVAFDGFNKCRRLVAAVMTFSLSHRKLQPSSSALFPLYVHIIPSSE